MKVLIQVAKGTLFGGDLHPAKEKQLRRNEKRQRQDYVETQPQFNWLYNTKCVLNSIVCVCVCVCGCLCVQVYSM